MVNTYPKRNFERADQARLINSNWRYQIKGRKRKKILEQKQLERTLNLSAEIALDKSQWDKDICKPPHVVSKTNFLLSK